MPIDAVSCIKDYHKIFAAGTGGFLASLLIGDYVGYPEAGIMVGALLMSTTALFYSERMSTEIEDVYRARYRKEMEKIVSRTPHLSNLKEKESAEPTGLP